MENLIENIEHEGQLLAMVIKSEYSPARTTFLTPANVGQQVGFIVYRAGGEVERHVHKKIRREIIGTTEVLLVHRGKCSVDFYSGDRVYVASRTLAAGDLLVLVSGGHGLKMVEDTVLLEVKQGPYPGIEEKERF